MNLIVAKKKIFQKPVEKDRERKRESSDGKEKINNPPTSHILHFRSLTSAVLTRQRDFVTHHHTTFRRTTPGQRLKRTCSRSKRTCLKWKRTCSKWWYRTGYSKPSQHFTVIITSALAKEELHAKPHLWVWTLKISRIFLCVHPYLKKLNF